MQNVVKTLHEVYRAFIAIFLMSEFKWPSGNRKKGPAWTSRAAKSTLRKTGLIAKSDLSSIFRLQAIVCLLKFTVTRLPFLPARSLLLQTFDG